MRRVQDTFSFQEGEVGFDLRFPAPPRYTDRPFRGSFNGRTVAFGAAYEGPNPSPRTMTTTDLDAVREHWRTPNGSINRDLAEYEQDWVLGMANEIENLRERLARTQEWLERFQGVAAAQALTLHRFDPEPQPGDGPDYHEDHRFWELRQAKRGAIQEDK